MPILPNTSWDFAALGVVAVAYVALLATWPLRHAAPHRRARVMLALLAAFALAPLAVPAQPALRSLMTIILAGILPAKIVDTLRSAEHWRAQPLWRWLEFVLNPVILVARLHAREPARSRWANALTAARGLVEVQVGKWCLGLWLRSGLGLSSFWLDHTAKVLCLYLMSFSGGNILATGLLRLLGSNVLDLSRDPILAVTPADFWRRYNRNVNQFLAAHVFTPLGSVRRPARGIWLAFLLNGVFHEYVFAMLAGRVTGYLLAFFALQAAAVTLTFRWRPRGAVRTIIGTVLTFAFNVVTSVLFFEALDAALHFYPGGGLLP
ncbi:MAG: hypothetical protein IPM13_04285 [Phycisphaerales bacterium]|nr:hypothetical protein [Phycisphaerales bacterium]